jgi:hypothetical protein
MQHSPGCGIVPEVMKPNAAGARTFNSGGFQYLAERTAKGGDRIPPSAWAGEERRVGEAGSEVLDGEPAAVNETLD